MVIDSRGGGSSEAAFPRRGLGPDESAAGREIQRSVSLLLFVACTGLPHAAASSVNAWQWSRRRRRRRGCEGSLAVSPLTAIGTAAGPADNPTKVPATAGSRATRLARTVFQAPFSSQQDAAGPRSCVASVEGDRARRGRFNDPDPSTQAYQLLWFPPHVRNEGCRSRVRSESTTSKPAAPRLAGSPSR